MAKIKDCFKDQIDSVDYEITYQNEVVMQARTLSHADYNYLGYHVITNEDTGQQMINPNYMILRAIKSWVFDIPINIENICAMTNEFKLSVFQQIVEHENEIRGKNEGIEKN